MSAFKVFGTHEERTVAQLRRCVEAEEGAIGALMPDGHVGYSMPIGGVVAYRDHVSPSGVGYDIGCGNKAVLTNLSFADVEGDVPRLMDEIAAQVSFGIGRSNAEPVDHPVLDAILESPIGFQREMYQSAKAQLGTVGAGNHYVDLFKDEEGRVWIGVHFGSRGFGHKTATHYIGVDDDMDAAPTLLSTHGDRGQEYVEAMKLAGAYAYAGRDVVCEKVLEILGADEVESVHNHHNFAWQEQHFGEDFWVVRKGATPAFPGQQGFVGSTMGEDSVILAGTSPGLDTEPDTALFSTVHGAGRAMSRRQAAGKVKRRKRYACMDRDCDRVFDIDGISSHNPAPKGVCPDHPGARIRKVWISEQVSPGLIDFAEVQEDLRERHIELRGGAADEAPLAYKRLPEVLADAVGVTVLHTLSPIGVAMAGANTYDPWKD